MHLKPSGKNTKKTESLSAWEHAPPQSRSSLSLTAVPLRAHWHPAGLVKSETLEMPAGCRRSQADTKFSQYLMALTCVLFAFGPMTLFTCPASDAKEPSTNKSSSIFLAENAKVDLNRFENDIKAFEKEDKDSFPAPGGTVFVGSSTFTKWRELDKDLAEFKPINRGFGGSTIPDVNHFVSRIVTKYKPNKVVFYAGTNDIAELQHSGKDVLNDFKTFVKEVQNDLSEADIYFISMSVAPCRLEKAKVYEEGNALVSQFTKSSPHLHYIDVIPAMRDSKGSLRKELFGLDNLHMNRDGYLLWIPIIRKALSHPKSAL